MPEPKHTGNAANHPVMPATGRRQPMCGSIGVRDAISGYAAKATARHACPVSDGPDD